MKNNDYNEINQAHDLGAFMSLFIKRMRIYMHIKKTGNNHHNVR